MNKLIYKILFVSFTKKEINFPINASSEQESQDTLGSSAIGKMLIVIFCY